MSSNPKSSMEQALSHFEATEANLLKAERILTQLKRMVPDGIVFGSPPEYDARAREFNYIVAALPAIDGFRLDARPPDLDVITQARLDAAEICEPEPLRMAYEEVEAPSRALADYRFRFDRKRRELIRNLVFKTVDNVDKTLRELSPSVGRTPDWHQKIAAPSWESLKIYIAELATLLGSSVKWPKAWSDLHRHLSFGEVVDLRDIIETDWPAIKNHLNTALYSVNEPLPVQVADLGEVVASRPEGPIPVRLNWKKLSPADFERLLFVLISTTDGYQNPEWLMRTEAPDRGRDLSVFRVAQDRLLGSQRQRVIIQCKHWLTKSVAVAEIATLKEQVRQWEPPRIDIVIIATSGRFTADAVAAVERHNVSDAAMRIKLWPESHLEWLLASRPNLIAEFRLREKGNSAEG